MNALSGSLASNITGRQQVFGTFTTGGTMPAVLSFTGKDVTYDPSQGNLLMDVLVLNTSFANDRYESYFEADGSGNEVSPCLVLLVWHGGGPLRPGDEIHRGRRGAGARLRRHPWRRHAGDRPGPPPPRRCDPGTDCAAAAAIL